MALCLLMLFALSSANGEDACITPVDSGTSASGDALLQTRRGTQQESVAPIGEEVVQNISARTFVQGAFFGYSSYQGSPTCVSQENRDLQGLQLQLLLRSVQQSNASTDAEYVSQCEAADIGSVAPLDATGFKQTTALCCPVQMEIFFTRLLQKKGYHICSKSHLQGLMHWFTCVPDMDFEYVISIIQNGNPCKYWAPVEMVCPTLSDECRGKMCTTAEQPTTTTITEKPTTTTTEKPTTEKPTTEKPTTEKPTTQKPTTTEMPTNPITGWWIAKFKEDGLSQTILDSLSTGKYNGSNSWFINGQPTGLGWGDWNSACDSSKVFCAGGALMGGHPLQANAIRAAIANGGKHPQAP